MEKSKDTKKQMGPTPGEEVLGGVEIIVNFKKKKPEDTARRESMRVKLLDLEGALKLIGPIGDDDFACLKLFSGKNDAWLNSLTLSSQEKILTEGERLNYPTLRRLLLRRKNIQKLLAENAVAQEMLEILNSVMQPLTADLAKILIDQLNSQIISPDFVSRLGEAVGSYLQSHSPGSSGSKDKPTD